MLEICDEVEEEDQLEVFGPQIELNLSNPTDIGEPSVEATGLAPTVVVEVEEEFSAEFVEKKEGDQAVKAGGEPAHEIEAERTGVEPVLENVEDRYGTESDLMGVEHGVRTRDEPVLEVGELRIGKKHVLADVETETGDMPVREIEVGDSHYEDFQGDDFEKVGEFAPEETPQTPADHAPEISSEQTPSSAEPQRKRIKTLAGRTDLPWVRKLIT